MRSKHQIRRGRGFAIRQRVNREADRREEKVLSQLSAEALAAVRRPGRLYFVRGDKVIDLGRVLEIEHPEKLAEFHQEGTQA